MAEQTPEHQDRALFGLFGKKKEEEEGKHGDQVMHSPASDSHGNEAQTEAASYYPTPPQPGVEHKHGHGHEGQFTPEEAEQQKHSKLHRTHSSSSSSSSDEEEEGRKKKEGGRKKKGAKDKTKEKLPGGGQHSSDQYVGTEEEKKAGLLDKVKEKLPGKHESKIQEEKKVVEEEKKVGLLDKIKEKLPGNHSKNKEGEGNTRAFLAFTAFCGVFATALIGCTLNQKFYSAVLGYPLPTLPFILSNMVPAVISIYFRPERGGIVSLGLMANLVGTVICLGKAMLVILFKEITIKRTGPLALQATTVSFDVRPRTSMRRFALTMFLLTMSIGVASSADVAAVNNTEAISFVDGGVPVGDKLPPDCYYVSKCIEDCMSCYPRRPRGPDFKCCT